MPARESSGSERSSRAPGVLVAGTTSDAGKSFVTTGLCRALVRRGYRVAPFKAVNMSLNSIATETGAEIAIAQWVQCAAARVTASADANPVLLKPYDGSVEVILRGRPVARLRSWRREMPAQLPRLRTEIRRTLATLRKSDVVVVAEGAGSPVELNLRQSDLSNFFVAEVLDIPVILVADLERGGSLAQVVGTLELLTPSERARVCGIIFNRLRGDERLFRPAMAWTADRVGVPVLGVLPMLPAKAGALPPEDSLELARAPRSPGRAGLPRLGIVRLPHTANFSDFQPLERCPELDTRWVRSAGEIAECSAILLPGTRRTGDDLAWLRAGGWPRALRQARARGAGVGGICGGFQLLGTWLHDTEGWDGPPGHHRALGLLPVATRFRGSKVVRLVTARAYRGHPWLRLGAGIRGYEIHRGQVVRGASTNPIFSVSASGDFAEPTEPDGARTADGRVWGTLLHGALGSSEALEGLVRWVGGSAPPRKPSVRHRVPTGPDAVFPGLDRTIDAVADLLEAHVDLSALVRRLGPPGRRLSDRS